MSKTAAIMSSPILSSTQDKDVEEETKQLLGETLRLSQRVKELEEMLRFQECENILRKTEALEKKETETEEKRTYLSEIIYGLQLARAETRETIQTSWKQLVEVDIGDSHVVNAKIFDGDVDICGLSGLSPLSVSSSNSTLVSDSACSEDAKEAQERQRVRKALEEELRSLGLKRATLPGDKGVASR